MSTYNIHNLFPFKRVKISKFKVTGDGSVTYLKVEPDKRYLPICSSCHKPVKNIHSIEQRFIRDLPMSGSQVKIRYQYRKVMCPTCGFKVEYHDFVDPYSRVTNRFAYYIYQLCQRMTIKGVADHCKLSWHQIKRIDKTELVRRFSKVSLNKVSILCIDEISIKKRHRYLTIIADYLSGQVVKVIKNRDYHSVANYLKNIPLTTRKRIKAVAMDMWDPYIKAFREYLPQADIVFDLFHVVSAFGRVIDKIRAEQYRKAGKEVKTLMKRTRFLLLKNPENLAENEKPRLEQILKNNQLLATTYILKDYLKRLWQYKYQKSAKKFLDYWCSLAIETKCADLIKFANMLKKHCYGILNHCIYPIHTGKSEGINNKIKVIKRSAYGFHDIQYFSLKIIQATTN